MAEIVINIVKVREQLLSEVLSMPVEKLAVGATLTYIVDIRAEPESVSFTVEHVIRAGQNLKDLVSFLLDSLWHQLVTFNRSRQVDYIIKEQEELTDV